MYPKYFKNNFKLFFTEIHRRIKAKVCAYTYAIEASIVTSESLRPLLFLSASITTCNSKSNANNENRAPVLKSADQIQSVA